MADHYRGRVYYPPAAQAAEYHLRLKKGILRIEAIQLIKVIQLAEIRWQVHFLQTTNQARHMVEIEVEWSVFENFENCSKPANLSRRLQFRLRQIQSG